MKNLDNLEKQKGMFPEDYDEEDERRMNIIGQNGNDGEHYDKLDINKDGIVDKIDQEIAKRRLSEIEKLQQNKSLTQEWNKNLNREKKHLQNKLDDLTKRY